MSMAFAVQERPAPRPVRPAVQRADIQGLRALAVGLVLVYHLQPDWLPGGFVGVDVFFVISGFLIIGGLTKEVRQTGRLRLVNFYARRIRRLLPAATVVLLTVVVATLVLLPFPRWPEVMKGVIASALNVQNWLLASTASDYANATAAASPVQHYWSLSVEEQFYLVIPLVLLLSAVIGRGRNPARWGFGAVALITVASFAYSVQVTNAPPGAAYFITPARMWELGIGGLLAIVAHRVRPGRTLRFLLGWGGFAAIVASAWLFTTSMAFPGWIALLPTAGTVALLMARSDVLGVQPLRYLGDISYSLYLWHWPVIVFVLEQSGQDQLTGMQVLQVLVVSLTLAALSKHVVEDPFRRSGRRRWAFVLGVSLVVVSLVAAAAPWQVAQTRLDAIDRTVVVDDDHIGADAFDDTGLRVVDPAPLKPDPAVVADDWGRAWADGCGKFEFERTPEGDACLYGNKQAEKTVVLVGDSHMTMHSTALIDFVNANQGWRLKVLTRDGCPFGDLPADENNAPPPECGVHAFRLQSHLLAMKPDLVVVAGHMLTARINNGVRAMPELDRVREGYDRVLRPLAEAGIPVVAIRDVPWMTTNIPRCIQKNPGNHSACDSTKDAGLGRDEDPLVEAVSALPGARTVDLTDKLCTETTCPAVVGNVIVYRDDHHLSDTYVRSLGPTLVERLGLNDI